MTKYNIGDQVRIKSAKELKELRYLGHDITSEMIECGGEIVIVWYIVPKSLWINPLMPEYKVRGGLGWTWYENLLEPIE
jgi:hypothetical protein|nr:MAG TPA: hypothetical protein [Caudoviricetes sp.]